MIANTSLKSLVLALIIAIVGGVFAISTEVTKSTMYERLKSEAANVAASAEMDKAKAEAEKAKAERLAAEAQRVAAENILHAAEAAQIGAIKAAEALAKAQSDAAVITSNGLIKATTINTHPDNEIYDSFTGPIFGGPAKRIKSLNDQIVLLRREAESGIDHNTRRPLSEPERADRLTQKQILEEELETVKETSSKTFNDAIGMIFGGSSGGLFGSLGNAYPALNVPPPPPRRIVQDR